MGDVECRACAAGLPIVWDVQRRRNMPSQAISALEERAHKMRSAAVPPKKPRQKRRGSRT